MLRISRGYNKRMLYAVEPIIDSGDKTPESKHPYEFAELNRPNL
jgi:hypothetical protein